MYSIIRFTASPEMSKNIVAIGEAMNAVRPGVFTGPRRAADGFACSLATSSQWLEHREAITLFLREFAEPIRDSVQAGAAVTIDVAIEPEDRSEGTTLVVRFDQVLMKLLASMDIALEVSYY